jgi:bifunctional diaminopimelate decarboxylase / aspartate kinase
MSQDLDTNSEPLNPTPSNPRVTLKFGGTSVQTAARWRRIRDIALARIERGERVLLVCSAVGGISNRLAGLLDLSTSDDDAEASLQTVRDIHLSLAGDLGLDGEALLAERLDRLTDLVRGIRLTGHVSARAHAEIMAHGELMSTTLGAAFLEAQGLSTTWMDARDLLQARPVPHRSESTSYLSAECAHDLDPALQARLEDATDVVITQGFIASNDDGHTVLLGRGGSDTSAAYLAARSGSARLEIWTDVPGLFSTNPKDVPDAFHIKNLSWDQAEALATLGAKVLHPRTLGPARSAGLPVHVRCTPSPHLSGTRIHGPACEPGVVGVTRRSGLGLMTMKRPSQWQSVGYMAEVASRFQANGLSMDLVSASPSLIHATVDMSAAPRSEKAIQRLLGELEEVCEPSWTPGLASVSLVGAALDRCLPDLSPALQTIGEHRVHMLAHGANGLHVTFVVAEEDARPLVRALHQALFESPEGPTLHQLQGQPAGREASA